MHPHQQTLSNIYAAFGRGDLAGMLAHMDEQIEWEYGPGSTDVPWLIARRGHAAVGKFLETVATEMKISSFEVKTILPGERTAVALVDIEFQVNRTGKLVKEVDEAHIWHFGEHGRVLRFRHAVDTLQHLRAWQK